MIYIVYGKPGEGKTATMTALAIKKMRRGRRVFTNYPIVTPDRKYSSLEWKPEYIYETIHDADIIIDEAYRDYSSRNFKDFGIDCHTFFATNRHNDINVYLIAQNPARVDVIIREMTNEFMRVTKKEIPFLHIPIMFSVVGYDTEQAMLQNDKEAVASQMRFWYSPYVLRSYDTKQFRNPNEKPLAGLSWKEILQIDNKPLPPFWKEVKTKIESRLTVMISSLPHLP